MPAYKIRADEIAEVAIAFHSSRRVPLFVGPPGIAKTAFVREAATTLDRMFNRIGHPDLSTVVRELHLASMSEVDIRGYLIPQGDYATFTKPEFWRTVELHPNGILFLDEFVQATHEVQKAVAPLILEGRIGEYQLPPGWSVMLAGNRSEDNAGANTLLSHITNRVTRVDVVAPDVDVWCSWATSLPQPLPFELIAFAKMRPEVVFGGEVPSTPDMPYCTPRSMHILGDIANATPGGMRAMVDSTTGMALIAGTIGDGPASELSALVRTAINLPSYEEVVADPEGTKLPTKNDQLFAMVMLMAVRAKVEHAEPVVKFITRFQNNFAITGIVSLMRRDRMFATAPSMRDWVLANQDMLQKFGKYITGSI